MPLFLKSAPRRHHRGLSGLVFVLSSCTMVIAASSARAESSLHLSYPPDHHETFADRIFMIGTADPNQPVLINGESIYRSPAGHFAPSVPLEIGENVIDVQVGDRRVQRRVIRLSRAPNFPDDGFGFAENSLEPAVDITRQVGELVCFTALAPLLILRLRQPW